MCRVHNNNTLTFMRSCEDYVVFGSHVIKVGVVITDSTQYNNKIIEFLDKKNTYEQHKKATSISTQPPVICLIVCFFFS